MSKDSGNEANTEITKMWAEIGGGYRNYGILDPDTDISNMTDLRVANEQMVDHVISSLNITENSCVLDLGCGRGRCAVEIAKRTGCRVVGTDRSGDYLRESEELAKSESIKAEWIQSTWEEMNPRVKEMRYTHIISLGALLYGHGVVGEILEDIAECCTADTVVFLWDFVRCIPWTECGEINRHMKMSYPILNKEEMLEKISKSPLQLTLFQDFTKYVIPGYNIIIRKCEEKDPNMKVLTHPIVGEAFKKGELAYVIYHLKLSE